MNIKKTKFKLIKAFFYILGFPALCVFTYLMLLPALQYTATEHYAKICLLIPFLVWALCAIAKLLLKFLAKKGSIQRDYATLILAVFAVGIMAVPLFITDKVAEGQFDEFMSKVRQRETATYEFTNPLTREKTTGEVTLRDNSSWMPDNFDYFMGWAIGNTTKGSDELNGYIGAVDSYIAKMCQKGGFETWSYGHAESKKVDYDINYDTIVDDNDIKMMGQFIGFYDSLEFEKQKKYNYSILSAKLNAELKILTDEQTRLAAIVADIGARLEEAKTNNNTELIESLTVELADAQAKRDKFDKDWNLEIETLGGQRVRIYEENIVALIDIIADAGYILPDGLDISLIGITLPVGDIIAVLGDLIDFIKGLEIGDTSVLKSILGLVLSKEDANGKYIEISTGIAKDNQYHKCAAAASKVVTENYTYDDIVVMELKNEYYPPLLCYARLRRIMYIFCGLVLLSILLVDHYERKLERINELEMETIIDNAVAKRLTIVPESETNDTTNETTIANDNITNQTQEIETTDYPIDKTNDFADITYSANFIDYNENIGGGNDNE